MKLGLLSLLTVVMVGCSSPDPAPPPPPVIVVQPSLACGAVDVQCNCSATTAYPGEVTNAPRCESGRHIFATCGYCPGGGYAWYTTCYCN